MSRYEPKVLPCDFREGAAAEYQDEIYGVGKRLHNAMVVKGKVVGYRCTVCGKEKMR